MNHDHFLTVSTALACLFGPAHQVGAQDLSRSRVHRLVPGTEIVVTVKGTFSSSQYVVLADNESELTVLNLADPNLPNAARNVLRRLAATHPNDLVAAERRGTFLDGNVRVARDGVFVAGRKVADLEQVIEHITRADVDITGPRGAPLAIDRPLEIAVGAGGVVSWVGTGGDLRVMVSVPRSERSSLEAFAGVYSGDDVLDTRGVYGFQLKRRILKGRRPGVDPFVTFGALGVVARYETYNCPYISCRARRSTHLLPPLMGLIGAGVQYAVTPRIAMRLDYQAGVVLVVPVGGRLAASLSIPLGPIGSRGATASR